MTEPPGTSPATRRAVLALSYDGSGFHGFAAQRGQRTVQGRLEEALAEMSGAPVSSRCAGRTDTGVHALAQVAHVDVAAAFLQRGDAPRPFDELEWLSRSLTKKLAPDVAVWRAFVAPEGFDARHDALSRRYRYSIETDGRREPLSRRRAWFVPGELDVAAMRLGCDPLLGEHDFSSFCRHPKGRERAPLRRRVLEASFELAGSELWFDIEANAFCHQMVRSIVAMLVAVGAGRQRASEVQARLRNPDRAGLPAPAPAEGLCLNAVSYPEHLGGTFG